MSIGNHPVVRRLIYERDKGVCHICGKPVAFEGMHLDHVIPRVLGGEDHERNLRVSHQTCNLTKSDALGALPRVRPPANPPRGERIRNHMTLSEMATALGLKDTSNLRRAIQRGILKADLAGKTWMVADPEVERYRTTHMGKRGFANPNHPLRKPTSPHRKATPNELHARETVRLDIESRSTHLVCDKLRYRIDARKRLGEWVDGRSR